MDVTTATRFHLGEHVGSSVLRLGLIPLLGVEVWELVVYDTLVIAVTQFHHADISLGRWDRWLRLVLVTPDMHKVHHSDWAAETNSNYFTVLSVWDRLAGSFRMRPDPQSIVFGLREFTDPAWQTFVGMLKTPVVSVGEGTLRPVEGARGGATGPGTELQIGTHDEGQGKAVAGIERPRRIVFICHENCNRSQMAEEFARMYGRGWVEAYSAGCRPAEVVHPKAVAAMRELGYDLRQHSPKALSDLPDIEYDVAVVMCDNGCPDLKAERREDWNIPVPKWMPPDQFRAVRDHIGEKVKELLARLRGNMSADRR